MNLTVEWVDRNDVYESDVYSERTPKLLQPMIPVIRVSTLRAWLTDERDKRPDCDRHCFTFDDLLAQLPEEDSPAVGPGPNF